MEDYKKMLYYFLEQAKENIIEIPFKKIENIKTEYICIKDNTRKKYVIERLKNDK